MIAVDNVQPSFLKIAFNIGVIAKLKFSTDVVFVTCCRQVTAVFNNFNGELEAAGASLHAQALQQPALDASEFLQTRQPARSSGSPKIAIASPGPVRKRKAQSYGPQLLCTSSNECQWVTCWCT